ncbi:hypothetical protein C1M56_02935 [Vibrio diazotrophicus]|nr:hypothetical protein C1M56_02935 [Vibrio diazotrophicus]
MRKRNNINYGTVLALFDTTSDSENTGSSFKIFTDEPVVIECPTSIMHRMFRLGQAYGIRHLRYLESGCKIIVGVVELPSFKKDLEEIRSLVNDEVLHKYIDLILAEIVKPSTRNKHIAISTGNYFS